jgi:hypothetical protein
MIHWISPRKKKSHNAHKYSRAIWATRFIGRPQSKKARFNQQFQLIFFMTQNALFCINKA